MLHGREYRARTYTAAVKMRCATITQIPCMLLVFPSCHSVLEPKLFPHMGLSALSLRISRRYSLIRRFFCVGQDVSCTYGNWRPTLARTLGNRTQHTGFWRPRRHLGTFARIYALPTFQSERRGVRAATYGRQLV